MERWGPTSSCPGLAVDEPLAERCWVVAQRGA